MLKRIMNSFNFFAGQDVGIDLGTANLLIYVRGEGTVINEPSVVAIEKDTRKCLAVGAEAKEMLGRAPDNIEVIRPLRDGVIADFEITEMMLSYFLKKLNLKGIFRRPTILICCPSNITSVERNAIRDAAYRAGAKRVFIEEEPKVAAIGADLDIYRPNGCMILDIGGGTTDVAILSLGGIVASVSLKIAGDSFDQDIINYFKEKRRVLIGEHTAEEVKKKIGIAFVTEENKKLTTTISGRDLVTGLPTTVEATSVEIETALHKDLMDIVSACKSVLEHISPELSANIKNQGIMLTGGGCLLDGFDRLLSNELKVPVFIAESPLDCVARGTGALLEKLEHVK